MGVAEVELGVVEGARGGWAGSSASRGGGLCGVGWVRMGRGMLAAIGNRDGMGGEAIGDGDGDGRMGGCG